MESCVSRGHINNMYIKLCTLVIHNRQSMSRVMVKHVPVPSEYMAYSETFISWDIIICNLNQLNYHWSTSSFSKLSHKHKSSRGGDGLINLESFCFQPLPPPPPLSLSWVHPLKTNSYSINLWQFGRASH